MPNNEQGQTTTTQEPDSTTQETGSGVPPGASSFQLGGNENTPKVDMNTFIPQEYAKEEWVQNIMRTEDPQKEFFRQFSEARSMVGRRAETQIPGKDASPEQWKIFYRHMGVPDSIDSYQISPIQWDEADKNAGEVIDGARNPEVVKHMATVAQELGITPDKFERLAHEFDKSMLRVHKDLFETQAKTTAELNDKYKDYMNKMFGPSAMEAQEFGAKILRESVDPMGKTLLNEIAQTEQGPQVLALLANFAWSFHKTFVGEDSVPRASNQQNQLAASVDALGEQARKFMNDNREIIDNVRHPEHDRTMRQLNEIYDKQKQLMMKG